MPPYCEDGLCANCEKRKFRRCEHVREGKLFCNNFKKSEDDD